MAIFFDAPVDPDALTVYVRNVPTPAQFRLSSLFPVREVPSNKVDFAEIVRTNRTARYRSYDGRIHVSERDTGSVKTVQLPPLSSMLNMGEYERLQLEFSRTGGTLEQALAESIYNDADNLVRQYQARVEQAWGDVLTDGILSINENGYIDTADYGVPGSQIVSAGTAWTSTTTATILTNLIAWCDTYNTNNGFLPGAIQPSLRIQRLMQQNTELINAIAGAQTGRTRVTVAELQGLFASEGLPELLPAYDTNVDVDGTTTRVIPDDKLIFFPPNIEDLGYFAAGVSATALELVNSNQSELAFEDAPGVVGVVEKVGPPYRQSVFVDGVGMPVLTGAKLLMIADVA